MLSSRCPILAFAALALLAGSACAQTAPSDPVCPAFRSPVTRYYRSFHLTHMTDPDSFTELQTVLRNFLQEARINSIESQHAIAVCGTEADLQFAQQVISDLDRPGKTWRLTYTLTRSGKSSHPAQHIVVLVAPGGHTDLRQGNRVPVVIGVFPVNGSPTNSVQYMDVGLTLTATLHATAENLELATKIQQTSLSDEKSVLGAQDPVVRQTVLEGTATLLPGRPRVLGSLDLPDGSGREEISVTAEPLP